jgi:hypothetical protein
MATSQIAPIVRAQARGRRLSLAETVASEHVSAACYSGSENIDVLAVVMPELKLCDVKRQIFAADLVIGADNAALQDAPEALNRVGMDRAHNVVTAALANDLVRIGAAQEAITGMFVGREQADLVRYGFMNESVQSLGVRRVDHPQHHVALAADSADHGSFPGANAARTAVALVLMLVRRLAAHIGFINLDNAAKLVEIFIDQRRANAMAHIPSGLVGTETEIAVDLPRAHALLAGQQQMDDAIPDAQFDVGILENGPGNVGEPIAAVAAIRALPFEFHGLERIWPVRATAWADHAVRPAPRYQIGVASFLVGERRFKLSDGHLDNLLRLLPTHNGSPYRQEPIWHA